MNRLTEHSKFCINRAVPSENLGDLCLKMEFCDEFDFCEGCPVKRIMDRLCEYEDTELEPKEIVEMKKAANIKRCQRKGIVGIPKNGNRTIIQRISFVNEAVKYIAEQCAFELKQDKLTVNTSKIPENIYLICTARSKYIERIIQACE